MASEALQKQLKKRKNIQGQIKFYLYCLKLERLEAEMISGNFSAEEMDNAIERARSEEEAILGDRHKVEARINMMRNETGRRNGYELELLLLMQRSMMSDVTCVARLREENQRIGKEISDVVHRYAYVPREGLETFERFHHFEADEGCDERCAVCLVEVQAGMSICRLDCKHQFCRSCTESWFANHTTCPTCRQPFE